MWQLVICIGISVMGCGSVPMASFNTEEACYRALREVRFQKRGENQTGEDTTDSLAYCLPLRDGNK